MPEQKAPEKITPSSAGEDLEVMSKSVFQTGMSWRVVESKWPGTCAAFTGFEVKAVAAMGETQVEELVQDTPIIRNRRKIQALIDNARDSLNWRMSAAQSRIISGLMVRSHRR